MLETKCVGDNFKRLNVLVTVLVISLINIEIQSPTSSNRRQCLVINVTMSPTSLLPIQTNLLKEFKPERVELQDIMKPVSAKSKQRIYQGLSKEGN